jgi:hypothetical protein
MAWPKIGDRVKKNPETWQPGDFDDWGAGEGVGTVVAPPWPHEDGVFLGGGIAAEECHPRVDVRWPRGRCTQAVSELLPATEEEFLASEARIAVERSARGDRDGEARS